MHPKSLRGVSSLRRPLLISPTIYSVRPSSSSLQINLQRRNLVTSAKDNGSLTKKLFYKANGTPRSKLLGTLVGFSVYAAISVYLINQANTEVELVNRWEESTRYLASLARVQSVDLHHYHTTDFENFKETAALYGQFLIAVAAHFPPLKDPSVQEALFKYLPEQDDEIHTIMRDACKATHTALQSDDIVSNALKNQVAVSRAMTLTLGQSAEAVLYVTSVRLKAQAKKLLELEQEKATTKAATPSPDSEAYQGLGCVLNL